MTEVIFNAITTIQNFIQIHQMVQKLHNLRILNVRHSVMVESTGLNSTYEVKVAFNVITSIQNVIQIHQTVQKLLRCFFTLTSQV
jgi:hypothetical protein